MLRNALSKHWRIIAAAMLLAMLVVTAKIARTNYDRALLAEHELKLAQDTVKDMQARQRDVAALDEKYTRELEDAKATIEDLRDDVSTGKRRLQLNATCTSNTSASRSLGNAPTPGLTADAQRDYWRLRSGINTITGQVKYLQDYIRRQC